MGDAGVSRHTILPVLVVAPFGASGAGAAQPASAETDALLLALDAQRAAAARREVDAYKLADTRTSEGQKAAEEEAGAAFEEWATIIERMAAIPAEGIVGLAVKAAQVCRTLGPGHSNPDLTLAESLQDDIARLVPGAGGAS